MYIFWQRSHEHGMTCYFYAVYLFRPSSLKFLRIRQTVQLTGRDDSNDMRDAMWHARRQGSIRVALLSIPI